MNLIDNLTGPMARVQSGVSGAVSKLDSLSMSFGDTIKAGASMAGLGAELAGAALAPVTATFETRRALGELASLGIQDLEALEGAATSFSNQWAGTSKADFITAAYDIKSGIASLTDEGVAKYTELAGVTATATKSTVAEMTNLFASGYGIYKDFYSGMSDLEFGEMFSAGIAQSVRQFKTTGGGMAQAISTLGAAATTARVPLEEQLSVLGMLQATMSGGEAGTKYKAFLRSAARAGDELGLSFLDANHQLLSMPEIIDRLKGKFGETMDAAEKMELQKAFGDAEAVALIDLMYSKTGDLENNIVSMYNTLGRGPGVARDMAAAINETEPEKYQRLTQQLHNTVEAMGSTLLPTVNQYLEKAGEAIQKGAAWIDSHQQLVRIILLVALALGGFLTVAGSVIAVVGAAGLAFTKSAGLVKGFIGVIKGLPDHLDTIRLYGMFAADGIKKGFSVLKSAGATAVTAVKTVALHIASMAKTAVLSGVAALKNMALGLVGMAKQAIITAVQAMPGLIASVWSFTAALLANPITWIILAIVALIVALVLLWRNWDTVTAWLKNAWNAACNAVSVGIGWLRQGFQAFLGFFQSVWHGVLQGIETIKEGFLSVVDWIGEKISWFGECGKKIIETLVNGIKSVAMGPVNAVKNIFQRVRNLLPFSDAKEGPLSTLTLSGRRTMTTYATGVEQARNAPSEAVRKGLAGVTATMTITPNVKPRPAPRPAAPNSAEQPAILRLTRQPPAKQTAGQPAPAIRFPAFPEPPAPAVQFPSFPEPPAPAVQFPSFPEPPAPAIQLPNFPEPPEAPAPDIPRPTVARERLEKVVIHRQEIAEKRGGKEGGGESRDIRIGKLILNLDMNKAKDLAALFSLVRELEDYTVANGGSVEVEPEESQEPA